MKVQITLVGVSDVPAMLVEPFFITYPEIWISKGLMPLIEMN